MFNREQIWEFSNTEQWIPIQACVKCPQACFFLNNIPEITRSLLGVVLAARFALQNDYKMSSTDQYLGNFTSSSYVWVNGLLVAIEPGIVCNQLSTQHNFGEGSTANLSVVHFQHLSSMCNVLMQYWTVRLLKCSRSCFIPHNAM